MSFITGNVVKVIANNKLPAWLKVGDIVRITETIYDSGLYLVSNGSQTLLFDESEIALASAEEAATLRKGQPV